MCARKIGPLYDKKRNLLTSDRLEMYAILLEQVNRVFTTHLPNKQVIDLVVFFSVESIAYQNDELFLTDITIAESINIDFIRELSSNSAAGPDGIPCSLLLKCAHELAPSLLIMFKPSLLSGVIDPSLIKLLLSLFLSRAIEQPMVTIAPFLKHLLLPRYLRE